jgi:hypothetical protein
MPSFLPALVLLEDHGGDWERYLEALYAIFKGDFLGSPFQFAGKRVGLKRHPIENGREATFWHFISEGKTEADRTPDIRRCERIRWPKAMIMNVADGCVKVWRENGQADTRVLIWCEAKEYLVVLSDRGDYVLPWTAYTVVREHQKRKLEKRWQEATQNS